MTTEAQALSWMPYEIHALHPEINPTCFIGSAAALRINGTEVIVMTRGRVDLEAVLRELTGNDYDIEQRYAACLMHSSAVEVNLPPEPEQLPVDLPAAEQLVDPEPQHEDVITTGGVPTYQGSPVVKYLDPATELEADIDPGLELEHTDSAGPLLVGDKATPVEDDEEL